MWMYAFELVKEGRGWFLPQIVYILCAVRDTMLRATDMRIADASPKASWTWQGPTVEAAPATFDLQ